MEAAMEWHNRGTHPGAVFVQLTTACNAACVNCPHPFTYGREGYHPKGVMREEVWDKILEDLREMGYRNQVGLYLHHEPLLDSSLFRKIRQVNGETEAYVVLSTNGALLDTANRRELIAANPRLVHININSAEKAQYEEMVGLDFEKVVENARRFISEASGRVQVEINCPVLPGVDTDRLVRLFPGVKVNVEYWANSRGGLLEGISSRERGNRFNTAECCIQPEQNFNILHDGSVILCCLDWAHESKADFPNILRTSIFEIYNSERRKSISREFREGRYGRYRMCGRCAEEMGYARSKGGRAAASGRDADAIRGKIGNAREYLENYTNRAPAVSHTPIELFVETANACNIRCIMCGCTHARFPMDSSFASLEMIGKMEPFYPGLLEAHLHGFGEPLLNRELPDIIRAIHRSGGPVAFDFFTNATLMNRKVCESLVDAGVDRIVLSIDGATKDTYEAIHKGAKWERLLENLAALNGVKREKGSPYPRLEINLIAMNANFHEFPRMARLAADHGIEKIVVKNFTFMETFPEEVRNLQRVYDPARDDAIIAEAKREAERLGVEFFFGHYRSPGALPAGPRPGPGAASPGAAPGGSPAGVPVEPADPDPPMGGDRDVCFQPWKTFYVKSNGEVKPCCFTTTVLGDLRRSTPEEIWNGAGYRKLREEIGRGEVPLACRHCAEFRLRPRLDDTVDRLHAIAEKSFFLEGRRTAAPGSEDPPEAAYRKATRLAEEGRAREAAALLEALIACRGEDPLWRNDLGCLYFTLGDLSKAGESLEKALRLDPAFLPALRNLAEFHVAAGGRLDEAVELYRKVLCQSPRDVQALTATARLLARTGRAGEAIPLLERALEIDPEDAEARSLLTSLTDAAKEACAT